MDDKNIQTTDLLTKGYSSIIQLKTAKTIALLSAFIELEQVTRDMTDKEFAKFLKVSQRKLSKWKTGLYDFSISELVYIFDKLDIQLNKLFNEIYHAESSDKNDKSTN